MIDSRKLGTILRLAPPTDRGQGGRLRAGEIAEIGAYWAERRRRVRVRKKKERRRRRAKQMIDRFRQLAESCKKNLALRRGAGY
jgi:hypothetical protein